MSCEKLKNGTIIRTIPFRNFFQIFKKTVNLSLSTNYEIIFSKMRNFFQKEVGRQGDMLVCRQLQYHSLLLRLWRLGVSQLGNVDTFRSHSPHRFAAYWATSLRLQFQKKFQLPPGILFIFSRIPPIFKLEVCFLYNRKSSADVQNKANLFSIN